MTTPHYRPAFLLVRPPSLRFGISRAFHLMIASAIAILGHQMSHTDKSETLTDVFGTDAPNLSRFGRGASSLAEVQESLRKRDAFRNEQNAQLKKGGPVRREQ
jgi:hypothetical protein